MRLVPPTSLEHLLSPGRPGGVIVLALAGAMLLAVYGILALAFYFLPMTV